MENTFECTDLFKGTICGLPKKIWHFGYFEIFLMPAIFKSLKKAKVPKNKKQFENQESIRDFRAT